MLLPPELTEGIGGFQSRFTELESPTRTGRWAFGCNSSFVTRAIALGSSDLGPGHTEILATILSPYGQRMKCVLEGKGARIL